MSKTLQKCQMESYDVRHPRPQAHARAALTVALGKAVEQLIVIGSFALKECCGWEGNAG